MSAPTDSRNTGRETYASASKRLLRNSLLDGLRELMVVKDWAQVTMSDVARCAGVSRQTVYNEFGSRNGLAQSYALRLVDEFTNEIDASVRSHSGDVRGALETGFAGFFASAAQDPMILSLLSGEAKPDLLKLITTDAAPLIESASERLKVTLSESWVGLNDENAGRVARAIARMALSFIAMPPDPESDAAAELAAVMGPAVLAAQRG
ncbi:TetR family transcriptional regulator [Gordonia zhaorongruii]|uniref:TetR family transcriptional regulator n=1 Tax=Gordonia zhaorongruii TaxID=2597659 RepID=UPI00104C3BD5|nr:TetR family transcriptional regulator [Gordonia zhaorongruii]